MQLFKSGNKKNNKLRINLILLIGMICLLGLFTASYFEKKLELENEKRLANEINNTLSDVIRNIYQTLEIYSLELKNLRSFAYNVGLDELTYTRFHKYAQDSFYEENYPGARGFGFIRYVELEKEAEYLKRASGNRKDSFQIKFLEHNPHSRFVIEYIEPEHLNKQAVGLDIGSELHRRSAALAAAHYNKVTLTAPITLVQANTKRKHGFLLLYPLYQEESSTNGRYNEVDSRLYGWVYAPLLIDEILSAIQQQKSGLNLNISDVTSNQEIKFFEGHPDSKLAHLKTFESKSDIDLFGRQWRISAFPTPVYVQQLSLKSPTVLYVQILAAFLIAACLVGNVMYLVNRRLLENRQKSELAAVVENGIEGTIGLDEKFCFKYWNAAAQKLFGFDDKVLGAPFLGWLEESYSADYLIDMFKRISRGNAVKDLEINIISHATMVKKYLHLNFQPIIQSGVFLGANVSMVDLTPLRDLQTQLEEKNRLLNVRVLRQSDALQVSSSLHESLLQGAAFLIVTTDINGAVTSANRKFEELLGFSHKDILDRSVIGIFQQQTLSKMSGEILSKYRHKTNSDFEALVYPLKHQTRIEGEFEFQHKNGAALELQLTISQIKKPDGHVFGYLFIADDIRDQKALRLDLELIRSAVQNAQDILLWMNESGSIYSSNPFAWEALGYSEYELKRLNVKDLLFFEVEESWNDLLEEIDKGLKAAEDQKLINRKGKEIPCLITLSKLVINGETFIFMAAKDISDRLAKEQALKDALSFAAQANLSKDQFLENMGHELRTPLNEVDGSLQLLQLTHLTSDQEGYLSQAKTSLRNLTQSIGDVLDCSEIIRNKLALSIQEVNLLDLLSSIGQALAVSAEDKHIEVYFDLEENLPKFIRTDPHRLSQLLMCLMTNAIKFTSEGDVVLKCSLSKSFSKEYQLSFQVIDTGIGISEEKQKDIFELFSQVEMESNRNFSGLGLGLTISKNIIELMSGSIRCESELGKGTKFSFTILVGKSEEQECKQSINSSGLESLRVLVVDDNEISLSVLSKIISQLGWDVEVASSAEAAILAMNSALDSKRGFDLALIDWNMPDRTGLDLVKDIRERFSQNDMPILVMVSAYTRKMLSSLDNRDVESLLSAFLTKPVTKTMLIDLINSVMGGKIEPISGVDHGRQKLFGYQILLVEDNETNQFIAKNLLQSQGAEVVVASEGEEAWSILNAQPTKFNIVLMDLQMPGWDGYRATREIRSDVRFKGLPILAMTANTLASDKRKCFEAGMNGHIGKPFELLQLIQEIIRLVKKPGLILSHQPRLDVVEQNKLGAVEATVDGFSQELERRELIMLSTRTKVNVVESLKRFGQSEDLYVKSLNMFVHELERYIEMLSNEHSLKLEEIKPVFHTLKGTAGLLGFEGLANLALECEQLANMLADKGCDAEPLASMIEMMREIKTIIVSLFEGELNAKEGNGNEVQVLESIKIQELKNLLAASNMKVIEFYSELQEAINAYSPDMASEIELHLSKLDFKEALDIVEKLERKLSEFENG